MLGFTPQDVDGMTLWEFNACVAGYTEAHKSGNEPPPPMDDAELAEFGIDGLS